MNFVVSREGYLFKDQLLRLASCIGAPCIVLTALCACLAFPGHDSPYAGKSVDLTREEFPEEKFDVALDKACLDSIACSPHGVSKVENYLQQMDRCVPTKTAPFR